MIKKHLRLSAAVVTGLLFMAACTKTNNTPSLPSDEVKLTAHTWGITAATISDSLVTDSSFYALCMEDDSLVFSTNNDYVFSDGSTVCSPASLPYGGGTWAFNSAQDTLLLRDSTGTMSWQVQSLTDSTLQVSYTDSLNSKAVTTTLSFMAKPE